MLSHHIKRAEGDPNELSVFMAISDLDRAKVAAERRHEGLEAAEDGTR